MIFSKTKKFCILILVSALCLTMYNYSTFSNKISVVEKWEPEEPIKIGNYCDNQLRRLQIIPRGKYWVLRNYIQSTLNFTCDESITLTTNADYTFLHNIIPSIKHWNGPMSVAVYAPGDDFENALKSIAYLRNCETQLIRTYVTFHLIFDSDHIPSKDDLLPLPNAYKDFYNCSLPAPYDIADKSNTYKKRKGLVYPINFLRNAAIEGTQTHFIFPLDIELYPSKNFIEKFLHMIKRNSGLLRKKLVFLLPHFEVQKNASIPQNKAQLRRMLRDRSANSFHQNVCKHCHAIPDIDKWVELEETEDFDVFKYVKRTKSWEPFFVSSRLEPLFDERYTWEGQRDKMSQGYLLCLLGYEYAILNNAFLVHKPGVRLKKDQNDDDAVVTTRFEKATVQLQINILFGDRYNCEM